VTDARGASATYSYNNNRHLVNTITYSAPGGITPTSNVTFGYDAAGNRTSMTDGLGSVSYQFNSLSRTTSEGRTFNDPNNPVMNGVSKTISYDYNLAGQVTSITDPFNATINYGYDTAGRLSSVSGTSFAGVTTYATSAQYRAWGALKSLNYGNNRTLTAGYNLRLQTTGFQIPNVLNKTYQYFADGKLRYSQDLIDDRFDRSYAYDHMSRIANALSGPEARGEPYSDNRPYTQNFGYDALNHLTSQTGQHWSEASNPSYSSFINNRSDSFGYDAEGNVVTGNATYSYNSAGQITVVQQFGMDNTAQGFDGNGMRVKTTETTFTNGQPSTEVRYYVRSTVLGGQVVTEMNSSGGKQRTFVYAGGQVLAWQRILLGVERVTWEHRDPSNASFRTTNEDGTMNGQTYWGDGMPAELDPSGADADVLDPYLFEPPPEENQGSLISYGSFGDVSQLGTTYSWDGIPMPADELFQMMNTLLHGRFGIAQALMRGTRVIGTRTITAIGHFDDDHGGDIAVNITMPIYGTDPMAMGLLFTEPQNSGFKLRGPGFTDEQMGILVESLTRIQEDDCKNFINETLAKYKVAKEFNSFDKLLNRATLGYYDVNADYTNADLGVDMRSTILLRDMFVNRGASAGGVGTNVFLTNKVFERSSSIIPVQSWNHVADTPSYIVHELFHVAGIDKSIIDSQQMTDAIRRNCRLLGSDRIIISH
ncbi:MAG: hypothetical protein ACXWID_18710, partial [Pyrinomonadaceae bacterium]